LKERLPKFRQDDFLSIGDDALRHAPSAVIICEEGLGLILGGVILMARDKCCHLGEFIGNCHNRIIDLSILYGVRKFDDQIHRVGLEWKDRTIDWL